MLVEILIVVALIALVFGYRKLPELGRRLGTGARELGQSVSSMVGDKPDAKSLGRSAGKGVREFKELKQAVNAPLETPAEVKAKQEQEQEQESKPE